ncbi:trypsin-like peptidase domain-containing protein [Parvularcula marina]|uniref:trypsin-like peptidase domain-containing protein n=1 Tax=Parvularcula marina TaxID=2292771 RepID=UPI003512B084
MRRICLALGLAAAMMAVQAPAVTASATPETFSSLVKNVMPAVVNISGRQAGIGGAPMGGGESLGSGFIIDSSGIVVTNNHVIDRSDIITVTLEDGREFKATLRGTDPLTDLAVLQMEGGGRFPAVKFGNSDRIDVGDWVVAIGQPFGLGGSVSAGIVSAKSRDIDSGLYDDFIQTDAAINRGNSGGPLFDMSGRVVGVNTIIYSQSGGSVGIGFAIPSNLAARVVQQLIEFGETQRGYLGVLLDDVNEDTRLRLGLANTKGALVTGVPSSGGPAAQAGIMQDDVIVRFNNRDVDDQRDLTRAVADAPIGQEVPVIVIRNGEQVRLAVVIARRETLTAQTDGTLRMSGLTLQSANLQTKALYGLADDVEGVVVTHVDPSSPLAGYLKAGDVISEIGWNTVNSPGAFETYMSRYQAANSGPVKVLVRRGDRLFNATINPLGLGLN